jgi:arylsulfatase A-like enzyme
VLVLPFLAACGEPPHAPPRLVVLLATCTLQRDTLSPYGSPIRATPRLEELARESLVFARHEAEAGQSGTDFAALFTGTQADVHGVFHHPKRLRPELELIGEAFSRAGYEGWFFNGHRMAAIDLGYGQGIAPERSLDIRGKHKLDLLGVHERALPRLLEELGRDPAKRAFVLVNFSATHAPYPKQVTREQVLAFVREHPDPRIQCTPAELDRTWPLYLEHRLELEWNLPATAAKLGLGSAELATLARVLEATYRTAVVELDTLVGQLVDAIRAQGLWEETLFSFTADHGETFYRPNTLFHWNHGLQLAPEILSVPWILHVPGVPARRVAEVTRSIDVFPTLAGLAGVAREAKVEGQDLAAAVGGASAFPELQAFAHTTVVSAHDLETFQGFDNVLQHYPRTDPALCWVRVRDRDLVLKLLPGGETGHVEAYDLAHDPAETKECFDPRDARHARLLEALRAYRARLIAGYQEYGVEQELSSAEELDRLRDLGYAR